MSEWTTWTGCTATCATGTERRIRRQLVVPWSFQNKMTCDGTTFACKTGSLVCNIEMGPRCSDGSKILDRIGSGSECDREHMEVLSCNIPECPQPPEGKQFNTHICLYQVLYYEFKSIHNACRKILQFCHTFPSFLVIFQVIV